LGITPEGFKDKEANLSERRKKLETELQKIKSEMLSNAQVCDFEDIPDPQLIENKDSELQVASENMLKVNELRKQQETLNQKLGKLRDEANTVKKKLEALRKEEEKAQTEWKNWLTKRGLKRKNQSRKLRCELTQFKNSLRNTKPKSLQL